MSQTKSDSSKTKSDVKETRLTVQQKVDAEIAQGFRGVEVDSTPNENYTVAGVTKGLPTPETDVKTAQKVRQETGLGLSSLEAAQREKEAK